nr:nudix hydrolase 2-like [Ipomoea batatas]
MDHGKNDMEILEATDDAYGGVIVDVRKKMDPPTFVALLRASISRWRQQGKRGVWLKLPIELSSVVDSAVKEGFWYHHAEATYLMMVYWIPETTPHTFPPKRFPSSWRWRFCHQPKRTDRHRIRRTPYFQSHNSFFGKSDLFFVCMLRPLSFTIKKQDCEIKEAQWMGMEEYASQPFVQEREIFNSVAKICLARKENAYSGFSALLNTSGFSNKKCYLYCNSTYTPS